MKKALLIAALLSSGSAFSDGLQIPLFSNHFKDYDQNEQNFGLIYEYDLTHTVSLLGGAYKNSYSKTSALVGIEAQYGHIGVQGGFATGYEELDGNKLQLLGSVFLEASLTYHVKARASVIPHKDGAIATSLILRW